MKKFVSVNAKYFKHEDSQSIKSHNLRLSHNNDNQNKKYSNMNFGDTNINQKYDELRNEHEKLINKKIAKNSNTMIDACLVFSLDQFKHNYKKDKKEFKKEIDSSIKNYMNEIKEKYGFEPIGYQLHLDEGHYEKGKFIHNPHAHLMFYNFDFKLKKSRLREYKKNKKIWSNWQDLAFEKFKHLGFERGINKNITKKEHQEKIEHIKKQKEEEEKKLEQTKKEIQLIEEQQLLIQQQKNKIIKDRDALIDQYESNHIMLEKYEEDKRLIIENEKVVKSFKKLRLYIENSLSGHWFSMIKKLSKSNKFGQLSYKAINLLNESKDVYFYLHRTIMNEPSKYETKQIKEKVDKYKNNYNQELNTLNEKLNTLEKKKRNIKNKLSL